MSDNTKYKEKDQDRYEEKKLPIIEMLEKPAIDFKKKEYNTLLAELQANILKHHRQPKAAYYFLQFKSSAKGVEFLDAMADRITSAAQQLEGKTSPIITLSITYDGYKKLEIAKELIPDGNAFRAKFADRIRQKIDKPQKNLEGSFDAVLLFAYNDKLPAKLSKTKKGEQGLFWKYMEEEYGVKNLKACCKNIVLQEGQLEDPMPKKYQFKENISNPRFFPAAFPCGKKKKLMQAIRSPKTSDLPPLGLVLAQDKAGNTGFSCGSYGAFTKIELSEDALDKVVKDIQGKTKLDEKQAAATLMGRFNDGTPLTLSDTSLNLPTNDFDYKELMNVKQAKMGQTDEGGSRCPFHAHIRKANPRTEGAEKRSIVRRGMYYKEKKEKGLLFLSFQNDLEKQFEFVLNNWVLSPNYFQGEGDYDFVAQETGVDVLFAEAGAHYPLPGPWNEKDKPEEKKDKFEVKKSITSFRAGTYFFTPSISFFKRIKLFAQVAAARKNGASSNKLVKSAKRVKEKSTLFLPNTVVSVGAKKTKGKSKKNNIFLPSTEVVLG